LPAKLWNELTKVQKTKNIPDSTLEKALESETSYQAIKTEHNTSVIGNAIIKEVQGFMQTSDDKRTIEFVFNPKITQPLKPKLFGGPSAAQIARLGSD
jgi:hypothetical protein